MEVTKKMWSRCSRQPCLQLFSLSLIFCWEIEEDGLREKYSSLFANFVATSRFIVLGKFLTSEKAFS
jgi:hypothetical protein